MSLGSGIRDPGSGINLFRIPDSGVKKAPNPGSRIRIRNTDRNLVITRPRKKDIITWQNNRVLAEDKELSPSLEEFVLDSVLGLIDTQQ
jgi:hypothetical protein